MRHRIANRLNFAKKALLFTVAVAAVAVPVVIGVMNPVTSEAQSQPLQLEVAAILKNQVCTKDAVFVPKQSKFMLLITLNGCIYIRNMPVNRLIYLAYGRPDLQISGTPEWANTQGYDLSLKLADPPPKTPVKEAVQKLLEEQFKLVFHREIKDAAVYDLVVADGGLKLTGEHSQGVNPRNQLNFNPPGHLTATDVDMAGLLPFLNRITQRVVVDKTGLKGAYDFTLDWTSDANHPDSDALIAALKNQLGLDLKPGTAPKEMLIVDHVERVGGGN